MFFWQHCMNYGLCICLACDLREFIQQNEYNFILVRKQDYCNIMFKGPHVSVFPILVLTEQVCKLQGVKLSQVYMNIHTHTQQAGLHTCHFISSTW
jgi:hypothetical protein